MTMDFNERVIPGVSSNFMFKEALARYKFAANFVKKDMKALDLGSGTGYGTVELAACGANVLGVDINTEAIEFSKKHFGSKNIKFKKGNILDFGKNLGPFDVITSFEVVEHLKNPGKFLENIAKNLKKDGVFIMSTPNGVFTIKDGKTASPYHEKEYKYEEIEKLLSKRFGSVKIYGQKKSKKAIRSWEDFMKSQEVRSSVIASDKLGVRKLFPKMVKEKIWKYLGNFEGRAPQEKLGTNDFPISLKSVRLAYYFVAVCKNPKSR